MLVEQVQTLRTISAIPRAIWNICLAQSGMLTFLRVESAQQRVAGIRLQQLQAPGSHRSSGSTGVRGRFALLRHPAWCELPVHENMPCLLIDRMYKRIPPSLAYDFRRTICHPVRKRYRPRGRERRLRLQFCPPPFSDPHHKAGRNFPREAIAGSPHTIQDARHILCASILIHLSE